MVHGVDKDSVVSVTADGATVTGLSYDENTRLLACRAPLAGKYLVQLSRAL